MYEPNMKKFEERQAQDWTREFRKRIAAHEKRIEGKERKRLRELQKAQEKEAERRQQKLDI